jgi:hypothetical protein
VGCGQVASTPARQPASPLACQSAPALEASYPLGCAPCTSRPFTWPPPQMLMQRLAHRTTGAGWTTTRRSTAARCASRRYTWRTYRWRWRPSPRCAAQRSLPPSIGPGPSAGSCSGPARCLAE